MQSVNRVVDIPVVAQRQIYMEPVQKSIETPLLQYCDDAIDVPVVLVVQAPLVQVMMKTVQIPQLPYIEKINVIPEIQTVPGPQTSESLSVDSKGLNHQDCEVLFHVNKQSPDTSTEMSFTPETVHGQQQQHNTEAHSNASNGNNHGRKKKKRKVEKKERREERVKEEVDRKGEMRKKRKLRTEVNRSRRT